MRDFFDRTKLFWTTEIVRRREESEEPVEHMTEKVCAYSFAVVVVVLFCSHLLHHFLGTISTFLVLHFEALCVACPFERWPVLWGPTSFLSANRYLSWCISIVEG